MKKQAIYWRLRWCGFAATLGFSAMLYLRVISSFAAAKRHEAHIELPNWFDGMWAVLVPWGVFFLVFGPKAIDLMFARKEGGELRLRDWVLYAFFATIVTGFFVAGYIVIIFNDLGYAIAAGSKELGMIGQ